MSFTPKYSQPFTLEEALSLDIQTIAAEIARLQHSLEHLRTTQVELQHFLESSASEEANPDQDIVDALKENETVINSQEERIEMLRIALEQKGGTPAANAHYNPVGTEVASDSSKGLYL